MSELKSAISSLKCVAEGPDFVHNEMLRHLPPVALNALLQLFNLLWMTGVFPNSWREAFVIPVLKAGKSGLDPLHYRPTTTTTTTNIYL